VVLCAVNVVLPLFAKRPPPPKLDPIVHEGVRYSAAGDGKTAHVVATDAAESGELWRTEIFDIEVKSGLEEDVQWIFITKRQVEGNRLLVTNEKSRSYLPDLDNRHVARTRCP
jgi:hypothetical protein